MLGGKKEECVLDKQRAMKFEQWCGTTAEWGWQTHAHTHTKTWSNFVIGFEENCFPILREPCEYFTLFTLKRHIARGFSYQHGGRKAFRNSLTKQEKDKTVRQNRSHSTSRNVNISYYTQYIRFSPERRGLQTFIRTFELFSSHSLHISSLGQPVFSCHFPFTTRQYSFWKRAALPRKQRVFALKKSGQGRLWGRSSRKEGSKERSGRVRRKRLWGWQRCQIQRKIKKRKKAKVNFPKAPDVFTFGCGWHCPCLCRTSQRQTEKEFSLLFLFLFLTDATHVFIRRGFQGHFPFM